MENKEIGNGIPQTGLLPSYGFDRGEEVVGAAVWRLPTHGRWKGDSTVNGRTEKKPSSWLKCRCPHGRTPLLFSAMKVKVRSWRSHRREKEGKWSRKDGHRSSRPHSSILFFFFYYSLPRPTSSSRRPFGLFAKLIYLFAFFVCPTN